MPHDNGLPILGGAFKAKTLELNRDWILERPRDIELQDFCDDVPVLEGGWRDIMPRIKTLLDGHTGRLGIHGPFWGFNLASRDSGVREVVRRRMLQGLEVCEALGATHMVIHSPYTTWDHNNFEPNGKGEADVIDFTHDTLAPAVRRAEEIGCLLVIENIEDKDPAIRVRLAESFKSDAVRVSIDTGHAHYAHGSTGAPPVDYYVKAAGNMLAHVHIQDADGYADRHWLPGEGTVNWYAIFAALKKLTSDPRLIIEVKDQANIRRGAKHLVDLGLAI
jgi:sugar phosphate isomerase/epimerase